MSSEVDKKSFYIFKTLSLSLFVIFSLFIDILFFRKKKFFISGGYNDQDEDNEEMIEVIFENKSNWDKISNLIKPDSDIYVNKREFVSSIWDMNGQSKKHLVTIVKQKDRYGSDMDHQYELYCPVLQIYIKSYKAFSYINENHLTNFINALRNKIYFLQNILLQLEELDYIDTINEREKVMNQLIKDVKKIEVEGAGDNDNYVINATMKRTGENVKLQIVKNDKYTQPYKLKITQPTDLKNFEIVNPITELNLNQKDMTDIIEAYKNKIKFLVSIYDNQFFLQDQHFFKKIKK